MDTKLIKNVPGLFKTLGSFLVEKKSPILLGLGIAGQITATIWGIKVTPKAMEHIAEYEKKICESNEDSEVIFQKYYDTKDGKPKLKFRYKLAACWKDYIPVVALTGLSTTSEICSLVAKDKELAAMSMVAELNKDAYISLKDEIKEELGEKKAKVIEEKVTTKKAENIDKYINNEVGFINKRTEEDCVPYVDALTGFRFWSNKTKIEKWANEIDREIRNNLYMSVNDINDIRGFPEINSTLGNNMYFNSDQGEFYFVIGYAAEVLDDYPCAVVDCSIMPKQSKQGR